MELLALVVSVVISFYAGYKYKETKKTIEVLRESLKKKKDVIEEPRTKSNLIDPLDMKQRVEWEYEQRIKGLNPDE